MTKKNEMTTKTKVAGRPRLLLPSDDLPFVYCPGCQDPIIGRMIAEVLEGMNLEEKTIGVLGIGCNSFAAYMLDIDLVNGPHGRAPDIATAVKRIYPDTLVFTMQGDGDLMSIGAGSLIGALTRGEKITIFMVNNAVYGTTGGQAAPTTLLGQKTSTTRDGRNANTFGYPTHTAEMIATFKSVAYSARGSLNTPANYQQSKKYIKSAFQRQIDNVGLSFVEFLTPCPPNWHMTPVDSLKWIEEKMITEYPLGEFKNVQSVN